MSYSIILFLQQAMFEKSQVTCNCFGATVPNQQKFFLTRKRQQQQSQPPQSSRRIVKSTQIKNQIDAKGQKKSLKKRPGSFVNADNHHLNPNEATKQESDLKPNLLDQAPSSRKNSWTHGAQTPSYFHNNSFAFKTPQNSTALRQPTIFNNHRQFPQTKPSNLAFISPEPFVNQPIQSQRSNLQLRPQLLQFSKQPHQLQQYQLHQLKQHVIDKTNKLQAKPSVSAHQITFRELVLQPAAYQSQKVIRKQTEKRFSSFQDGILIENFEKLLINREENRNSHAILQNKIKPRQAQKSKRFQQQKLMGRFAQSQDQDCAESIQSQVIGKGFDRTYQDLLEADEPIQCSQTKASRSTNTKVSNLIGSKNPMDQHERMKFGNLTHFTSYERL